MAIPNFNAYYPQNYQQGYPQNSYTMQPTQNMTIQNGGFIPVSSEEVARNYPVAPGNSVTFKNENAPYVYTKTMGFSQLDRPIFEKFKLVREEDDPPAEESRSLNTVDELKKEIESLWGEISVLKEQISEKSTGKENGGA